MTENIADVSRRTGVSPKIQQTMGFFARFSRLGLGTIMESETIVTFACATAIIMALCGSIREINRKKNIIIRSQIFAIKSVCPK